MAQKVASYADISKEWEIHSKRERQSRYTQEEVVNVGTVNVLKINNYTLSKGEPSVHERELLASSGGRVVVKKALMVPENQDYCQYCWDGGHLYCCSKCPSSYHVDCLYPEQKGSLEANMWNCPHHRCVTCNSNSFLFRCDCCPMAYCEDCLPPDHVIIGVSPRWKVLGFKQSGNSCMVYCSRRCSEFTSNTWYKQAVAPSDGHSSDEEEGAGGESPGRSA